MNAPGGPEGADHRRARHDGGISTSPAAPASEQSLVFDCAGETLVGVLALPAPDAAPSVAETAVLIVVGGPQYRGGSHRQFVLLARALAAAGHPTLRFDYRGMGDSSGEQIAFDQATSDIGAALDALQRACPQVRRVVLWGLCDGASLALLYLDERRDARVAGLILLNPWVRSEATLARTHVRHYYVQRLRQREFWAKLLGGKVAIGALGGFVRNLETALTSGARAPAAAADDRPFQQRMLGGIASFDGPVALILSGNDFTAKEFIDHSQAEPRWQAALGRATTSRITIAAADHTFSDSASHRELEAATLSWMNRLRCPVTESPRAASPC